jgi:aspartyl-tRNA(Asn)/glutamyl-tRNA(Gln) amidotransferase subunit A
VSSAVELARALRAGELRARDVIEESLARISAGDGRIGAFHALLADQARERAEALDRGRRAGRVPPPLFGVPVALKENLCLAGAPVPCGSRLLGGYRPPYTATAVERLLAAGAVVVGMTHMDEFAMGSSGENSAFRATANPWDLARSPGGSSSGSAAAVAAGFVPLALGSDTGGSVRQPAALTGVTGFKPTYGRVSRYGLVAFGSSLDQISPFARSAEDAELCFAAISGRDPKDMTTLPDGAHQAAAADGLSGKRIGVPAGSLEGVEPGVRARVEEALESLRALGAELVPIELANARFAIPAYYVVANAEASSNLARFDGVRFGRRLPGDGSLTGMMAATRSGGFGAEVKRRILLGTYVLSSGYHAAWYGRAQKVRGLIARDYARAFERVDFVATPTSPTTAFRLGERVDDPVAMYLSDLFTVPANLAGLPAISLPVGTAAPPGAAPLPVGLQLVARARDDAALFAAARRFQRATHHHLAAPPLAAAPA